MEKGYCPGCQRKYEFNDFIGSEPGEDEIVYYYKCGVCGTVAEETYLLSYAGTAIIDDWTKRENQ